MEKAISTAYKFYITWPSDLNRCWTFWDISQFVFPDFRFEDGGQTAMKESGGFCASLAGRKESMETSIWPRRGNFYGKCISGEFLFDKEWTEILENTQRLDESKRQYFFCKLCITTMMKLIHSLIVFNYFLVWHLLIAQK